MPSGVQVFAVLLHAHLAGRAIRTRHFRDHEELKPLAYDDEFDFNFQEFLPLSKERLLLPVGTGLLSPSADFEKTNVEMSYRQGGSSVQGGRRCVCVCVCVCVCGQR